MKKIRFFASDNEYDNKTALDLLKTLPVKIVRAHHSNWMQNLYLMPAIEIDGDKKLGGLQNILEFVEEQKKE